MVLIILKTNTKPRFENKSVKLNRNRKSPFSLSVSFKKINTTFQKLYYNYQRRPHSSSHWSGPGSSSPGEVDVGYSGSFKTSTTFLTLDKKLRPLEINTVLQSQKTSSNLFKNTGQYDMENNSTEGSSSSSSSKHEQWEINKVYANSYSLNCPERDEREPSSFSRPIPIYHQFYLNKDFAYSFLRTKICVEKYDKVIELPLQPTFTSIPSPAYFIKTTGISSPVNPQTVEGPVFINLSSPIVIEGSKSDHVAEWYCTLAINRSYYDENFHAEISLSCQQRKESKDPINSNKNRGSEERSEVLFVGVELQMLNSAGEVQLTRRCDEVLRAVSDEIVARFYVPYFIDLRTLLNPAKRLIHTFECYCRIVITCITGNGNGNENNISKIKVAQPPQPEITRSILKNVIPRGEWFSGTGILIKTNTISIKIPWPSISFIHAQCPSLFSEVRSGVLHLETFSSNSVIHILSYILTANHINQIRNIPVLQETIELAQRYKISHLRNYCIDMLADNFLCPETAAQALVVAFVYGAGTEVCSRIKEYFLSNVDKIRRSENSRFYIENCPLAFTSTIFGPVEDVDESNLDLQGQYTNAPLNSFLQDAFLSLGN